MKYTLVLLVCIGVVYAQTPTLMPDSPIAIEGSGPSAMPSASPSVASAGLKDSPVVTIPANNVPPSQVSSTQVSSQQVVSSPQVSPPRPKGCSPGCGPNEICAELGLSYCRPGQSCSVCIRMSSIRFPASAVYSMFTPPKPAVPAPQLTIPTMPSMPSPVMPSLPTQAASNPFSSSNTYAVETNGQTSKQATNSHDLFGTSNNQQSNSFTGYYNTQPSNNFDIFGFPIQQQQPAQQQQGSNFNSMFPLFWMGDFGMGF